MNLIGHFACAQALPQSGQLGALLPDVLALYSRRARIPALLAHWEAQPETASAAAPVLGGVRFHLHVDRVFHKHPLFTETARALRETLQAASDTPGLKRFFPAHVLTELYYDHLLLHGSPRLPDAFHAVLRDARDQALAFAEPHPAVERESLAAFLTRMVEGRFADAYLDFPGIFRRMNRMLGAHGQRELEAAETEAVRKRLTAHEATLRQELAAFVADMQHWSKAGGADAPTVRAPYTVGADDARVAEATGELGRHIS